MREAGESIRCPYHSTEYASLLTIDRPDEPARRPVEAQTPSNGTQRRSDMPQKTPVHPVLMQYASAILASEGVRAEPARVAGRPTVEEPESCRRAPSQSAARRAPPYHSTEILAHKHKNSLKTRTITAISVEWYGPPQARPRVTDAHDWPREQQAAGALRERTVRTNVSAPRAQGHISSSPPFVGRKIYS